MKVKLYKNKASEELIKKCNYILASFNESVYRLPKNGFANLVNTPAVQLRIVRASTEEELYFFEYRESSKDDWTRSALFAIED